MQVTQQICLTGLPKEHFLLNVNGTKYPVDETVGNLKPNVHTTLLADQPQPPSTYLDQRIFRLLVPALEETLVMAYNWNALRIQKCLFNGLDHLAELLWRRNPCRSKTVSSQLNVFDIPLFQQWLRLRPPYPKSWIWTMDEAALCLQRYIRGWIVRKRVDVQELRQFWKDLAAKNAFNTRIGSRTVQRQRRQHQQQQQQQQQKQQEGIAVLDGPQTADQYDTFNAADSLRCKKHRRQFNANRTNDPRAKDTF